MKLRPFTYHYFQPKEYQFSLDSIETPFLISNYIKDEHIKFNKPIKELKVLDLCCGCGVIGFELSFFLNEVIHFSFVEVQEEYQIYFEQNKKMILQNKYEKNQLEQNIETSYPEFNFHLMNYENMLFDEKFFKKFDLIVSNPPYFLKEQGTQSPNRLKHRSRFFMDSTFLKLIETINYCLAEKGHAFFLVSNLKSHNIDLIEEAKIQCEKLMISIEIINSVRGTNLVHIFK